MIQKIFNQIKDGDKTKLALLIGIMGIFFILCSEITIFAPKEKSTTEDIYAEKLAKQICAIIEKMDSVGEADVLITLEKGEENEYVYQEKISTDDKKATSQKEYVLIGSGTDKRPLISSVNEPVIKGVLVVCDGAEDPKVYGEILTSVTTLLGISSSKVHITKSR